MDMLFKQTNTTPRLGVDIGVFSVKGVLLDGARVATVYRPTAGNPAAVARECLKLLLQQVNAPVVRLGLTGHNARLVAERIGISPTLEVEALQAGLVARGIAGEAVFSLGHESMYYLELDQSGAVTFFNRNGHCAAGSGSFWHQQATRMGYSDQEFAAMALTAQSSVKISGRCAVFAKSDMTHAINEGASQMAVASGMAKALVDLVVTGVAQNRLKGPGKLVVLGGVANNQAILKHLEAYCLERAIAIEVPDEHEYILALGAAQYGAEVPLAELSSERLAVGGYVPEKPLPPLQPGVVSYSEPLATDQAYDLSTVYLGVDCGSVSTKCALLDARGNMMGGVYLPTAGRPALQLLELLKKVEERYGSLLQEQTPIVACTTGSGRFLAQKIINAEYAVDEITCQAEGVKTLFGDETLSIIEIGGEDSKFVQIKNGILFDYNMNPVCAAGTGTFLENLAELLGVNIKEEFSQKAFHADYAIDLGDTCTLLSQSSLVSAAARGLPLEAQLASLAYSSARNYLNKTVENRALEGRLVFTGATAKNHALASAFAAECNRQVYIPPFPELTGARGAALMASVLHLEGGQPVQTLRSLKYLNQYTLEKRPCKAPCYHQHNCQLDVIKFMDGSKFVYGDRCGRYSELAKQRQTSDLPNYQHVREQIFQQAAGEPRKSGVKVGIACSGLYHELYPFWAAFFRELGVQVVLSGKSGDALLEQGKMELATEMCYPVEVLIGHYRELLNMELDYIFIPEVMDREPLPWATNWPDTLSCPLLMMIRGVAVHALDIPDNKVLQAQLNYRAGQERIGKQLLPVAQKLLGKNFSQAVYQQAVDEGYRALHNFHRAMEEEGRRIIEGLRDYRETVVTLILGRSYTLYDPFVAKDVMTYAAQRGLLAIPQDFLIEYLRGWYEGRIPSPFLEARRAELDSYMKQKLADMDNIYAAQLQHMLSAALAAQFLNERSEASGLPQLHLVLQDPFRCGPNSMFRHYLDNVAGYLRLTLDEHTAPAGMITRLEALKNTCRFRKKSVVTPFFSARTTKADDLDFNKVLIPNSSKHAAVFKSMFENYGLEAELLDRGTDKDLTLARRWCNGEECLPFIQNMQDYLEYAEQHPNLAAEGVVLFQGWSCGPCRYGLYAPTQSMLVNRAGYGTQRILAFKTDDIGKRFGREFVVATFDNLLAVDILNKMLHQIRPYELNKGATEALFNVYCEQVYSNARSHRVNWSSCIAGSHLKPLEHLLAEAAERFAAIPRTNEPLRPRIMVAGEFYVRLDDRCNQGIIEQIEAAGGEVSLAPATEFFSYDTFAKYTRAEKDYAYKKSLPGYLSKLGYATSHWISQRDERLLEQAAASLLHDSEEPTAEEIREYAAKYVPEHTAGEPPLTIGRTAALAGRERIGGAIFVAPFTCMPSSVVEAHQGVLSRETGIPIITVYYDGRDNTNRDEFIASLVFQAKQYLIAKGSLTGESRNW